MSTAMSRRANIALTVGVIATVIPGMIVAGFMPEWNTLPLTTWFAIATIGSAVAGVIGYPRQWLRASIAGAITGPGVLLGILLYVHIRSAIIPSANFLKLEIAIGALLGGIPGLLLFTNWVKPNKKSTEQ